MKQFIALVAGASLLTGCGTVGRLKEVGKAPKMTQPELVGTPAVESSLGRATPVSGYGPNGPVNGQVNGQMPPPPAGTAASPYAYPAPAAPAPTQSASLFRDGAGALFQDQRAHQVGDILTIRVNVDDNARFQNATNRSRTGSESAGIASLLGLEKILPGNPANAVSANSGSKNGGQGDTTRSERINMTLAAVVTQVMPNGNLAIRGRQEMRVNYELRELIVTGIIRPQDISRDNSVVHSKIADARVVYGGRGRLSDVQQARYGQQIYDILFPF